MQRVKIDRFLRLGIGALAVVFVYIIYAAIHEHIVVAGDTAPHFTVTADSGQSVSVPNTGTKLLILNFWASWCEPCAQETPSLSQLAQDYASKGVEVLGISVDKDPAAYQRFLKRFSPAFLVARDLQIHQDYGTYIYPESYFINAQGRVIEKIADPVDWSRADVRQAIDRMLQQ